MARLWWRAAPVRGGVGVVHPCPHLTRVVVVVRVVRVVGTEGGEGLAVAVTAVAVAMWAASTE